MSDHVLVYAGTYTVRLPHASGLGAGIGIFRLRLSSGALEPAGGYSDVINPSYLALAPGGRYLYSVSEVDSADGQRGGLVNAFALDPASGALSFLNRQPSHGNGPCHLSVDPAGRWLMVANYNSGSIAVYPLGADGRIGAASATIQHSGSSVNADRQEGPHAHCILTDPEGRRVFAVDLGADKVFIYQLSEQGGLSPASMPHWSASPGAGPRHMAFHPGGRHAFVVNELDSTLTALAYDPQAGTLREAHTVSTLPVGFAGENTCAALHVAPSGRFVYASNRGHDSIAAFSFEAGTGRLSPAGHTSTGGQTPRDFMIDPTETYVLAANQESNTVVTFRINPETGALQATGQSIAVNTPACLVGLASA
jgi:6-phosphogluconolactonase